jgi:cytochrome c biogenesis protein CcmG, thiol:disulfide interchange protein DsbE
MDVKMKWYSLILASLMIVVLAGSANSYPEKALQARPTKGFALKDLNSKKVSLADFRGKVILLNFFTTWCPPCRIEIPELEKIYQKNKLKGLVVLGISLDTDVPLIKLKNFVKDMKITYPILVGNPEVADDFQVSAVPITLVINKEGKTQKRFDGLVPLDYLENAFKDLLETNS